MNATRAHVSGHYAKIKLALAYSEIEKANTTVFTDEVVEPDSGRTGSDKKGSKYKISHLGRTLIIKGRTTKKWVVAPLDNKTSKRGSRGSGGPETTAEVAPRIKQALGLGTDQRLFLLVLPGRCFKVLGSTKAPSPSTRHSQHSTAHHCSAQPNQTQPNPTQPNTTQHNLPNETQPSPAKLDQPNSPVQPNSTPPSQTQPNPAQPNPARASPPQPNPTHPSSA